MVEEDLLKIAAGLCAAGLLLAASPCRGEWLALSEAPPLAPAEEAPVVDRTAIFSQEEEEEPEGFWSYLKERVKLGYGYDMTFDSNIFLQDNNRREDLISTLESQLFFVDSHGALQYGTTLEVNANRHHKTDRNSIDWDGSAFLDFDPGGLYKVQLTYKMLADNRLVRSEEDTDFFRRGNDFQRQVSHDGKAKFTYALNATDDLVNTVHYKLVDDQVANDRITDRRTLRFTSTFDREFKPTWTLSAGYEFEKLDVPGGKTSSSVSHLGRISLLHELTDDFELEGTFKYGRRDFHLGAPDTIATFELDSKYPIPISPRLIMTLKYADKQTSSYTEASSRLRARGGSIGLEYELSPTATLTGGAGYNKNRSSGGTSPTSFTRLLSASSGLKWQLNPKLAATVSYNYARSKTRDTTSQKVVFGFEGEF